MPSAPRPIATASRNVTRCAVRAGVTPGPGPCWLPVGCPECSNSGYKGRTGVYELMTVDERVQALIHARAPESELIAAARGAGLRSMREDGERLVAAGITSMEELLRVTRD